MCGFITFENEVSVQNIMAEAMLGTTVFEVDGVKVAVKPKIKKEKAEKQRIGISSKTGIFESNNLSCQTRICIIFLGVY